MRYLHFRNLLVGFLFLQTFFASAQKWQQQNPKPGSYSYWNLHVVNSQQAVCMTGNNLVAVTINGGNYWSYIKVHPDSTRYASDLVFTSPLIGYIAVPDVNVFKTTDGGLSWVNTGAGSEIQSMYFESELIGFASSNQNSSAGTTLFKTTDGGQTWVQTGSSPIGYSYTQPDSRIPGELWAGRNSGAGGFSSDRLHPYKSTNGGLTWTALPVTFPKQVNKVEWFDAQRGWISLDSGIVAKTINGGANWTYDTIPGIYNMPIKQFEFLSPTKGFALEYYGQVYTTEDGGENWTVLGKPDVSWLESIDFISAQEGWGVGQNGLLAHTTDGGMNWTIQAKGRINQIYSACLQGNSRVWVVGAELLTMVSDDKGMTWTELNIDTIPSWRNCDITFPSPNRGFIAGSGGVYKSEDGGLQWVKKTNDTQISMDKLSFINPDTGWAVSEWGLMARTYDGGENWTTLMEASQWPVLRLTNRIQFLNAQVGFWMHSNAGNLGGSCSILKTMDGGNTWTSINQGIGFINGSYFYFLDENNGYLCQNNVLMHTVDGGGTWQSIPFVPQFSQIKFLTPLLGFGVGFTLSKTEDGGISWTELPVYKPIYQYMSTMVFQGLNPVLAAGSGGSIYTANNFTGSNSYIASGRLVKKLNNDCVQDAFEPALKNYIVSAEPGPYFASTGTDGRYYLRLEEGIFNIKQVPTSPVMAQLQTQYCPPANASIPIVVNGLLDTLPNNNFIDDVKLCPILVVTQTHQIMRPCRRSQLYITIQNMGNTVSDSEWVHVKLPPQLHFISASAIGDFYTIDSTYRFKVKPLQPNQAIAISIVDSVICTPNALLGQVLCVKATIPNAPGCLTTAPNWDGADLEVASRCQNNQTRFTIHNKGAAMPATSQYQIFIDSALVYQAPFQLAANSSMTVTLPLNAPTGFVRLRVPQSANHPLATFAAAEANCATGLSSNGLFPPPDESPLVDIECGTVRNGYDPNDKSVFPTGWGTAGNIEPEAEFTYKIRFQNTGNDTAFKVVLVDTLDENLDIASLQVGAASHAYSFKVSGKGRPVLTWTFNNILLPDSITNQLASNGFVSFSIRPKTGLPLGTRLENFADIYFDFNDPVRTNTTVNTLWRPTLVDGILDTVFVTASKATFSQKELSLFPNPSKGRLELNSPEAGWITLYSTNGEAVLKTRIEAGHNAFNFAQLPKGLYLAQLQFADGQVSKKVILE